MKQYTTPEQTSKLIELGFEKPKSIEVYREGHCVPFVEQRWDYSIGELIEMLPKGIGDDYLDISAPFGEDDDWLISYGRQFYDEWEDLYTFANKELIDALYDMVIVLKKEGVL